MTRPPAPFIVGVERSGTTLLRMMLDAHRDLAIPFETHFVHKLANSASATMSADGFFKIVIGSVSWRNMALEASALKAELDAMELFSVADGIRVFYRLCAARHGKTRWGDKTPSYLNWMSGIEQLLPEAHFIHIIRDGRDLALSFRGLWFGPGENIEAAARHWKAQIEAAKTQSPGLQNYLEVRYEDLVLNPHETLNVIADFVDVSFDPGMLDYHLNANSRLADIVQPFGPNGGNSLDIDSFRAIHANVRNPPDRARIGRWRTELTDTEQQRFEAVAGDLLDQLGYETRFSAGRLS
jgi:Sulfotransferase family